MKYTQTTLNEAVQDIVTRYGANIVLQPDKITREIIQSLNAETLAMLAQAQQQHLKIDQQGLKTILALGEHWIDKPSHETSAKILDALMDFEAAHTDWDAQ
ncbi:hypothetical protein IV38_GL000561 [Lactobacillus selangorensis]|uniref:Uncharacterized protein n=1 Tax=Lactobacillus selangorensis TaxID=81857 RepID=A0A0R2FWL3_9LACO|nr:hypothetical protein [Lactobacillus selangorensis]KRN29674.1 hypothetical protein IV38_GL000561 [Lactobacillus selangorensis]KRN33797.1 hypothetical protein IV40_GL000107 [Lactobacillus selangorensis]